MNLDSILLWAIGAEAWPRSAIKVVTVCIAQVQKAFLLPGLQGPLAGDRLYCRAMAAK